MLKAKTIHTGVAQKSYRVVRHRHRFGCKTLLQEPVTSIQQRPAFYNMNMQKLQQDKRYTRPQNLGLKNIRAKCYPTLRYRYSLHVATGTAKYDKAGLLSAAYVKFFSGTATF